MQPTHLISYLLISYTPTQLYIYAPHTPLSSIDPFRLISILRLIFPPISRSWTRRVRYQRGWLRVRVAWVGRFGGLVHRCGKGRGEEVVRTAG